MTFNWPTIQQALLNTVLCMGIVFIMLIFISLLISSFALIPKIQAMFSKPEPVLEVAKPTVIAPVVEEEPEVVEELSDDLELVAVITAAIMASMGNEAPADGLVVRSIKRANTKKWQRA